MTVSASPTTATTIEGRSLEFEDRLLGLIELGYQVALAMLNSDAEAMDAVQEAAILAWQHQQQLRDSDRLRPWFLRIVANECRRVRRHRWWSTLKLPTIRSRQIADDSLALTRLTVEEAFQFLRPIDRAIILLRYYYDLPPKEVGRVLSLSEGAVRVRAHRARSLLMKRIGQED